MQSLLAFDSSNGVDYTRPPATHYAPVTYVKVGAIPAWPVWLLYIVQQIYLIGNCFSHTFCDTLYNTGECTDIEYIMQVWSIAIHGMFTALNFIFLGLYLPYFDKPFPYYIGKSEQLAGDWNRQLMQFFFADRAIFLGYLIGIGMKSGGGWMDDTHYTVLCLWTVLLMMLCRTVVRGGSAAAPLRDPFFTFNPVKYPANFFIAFYTFTVVFYFCVLSSGAVHKYWVEWDDEKDNTKAFLGYMRYSLYTFMSYALSGFFVASYGDTMITQRKFILLIVLTFIVNQTCAVYMTELFNVTMSDHGKSEGFTSNCVNIALGLYAYIFAYKKLDDEHFREERESGHVL